MRILGISAFYHDSAAALIKDGHIVAAPQEERFTRKKQDAGYPEKAIRYCLDEGGLLLDELDYIVFYAKVRLDTSKPARFSASAQSTGWFECLLRTRCAIYHCPRHPKGRSWPTTNPESG